MKNKYVSEAWFFILFYMKLMNQKFSYKVLHRGMEDQMQSKQNQW